MGKFRFTTAKKKKSLKLFCYNEAIEQTKKISGAKIETLSNREITIDGCRGIMEYSDTYLRLKIVGGYLIISGNKFDIPVYDGPVITVTGFIKSIEFFVR